METKEEFKEELKRLTKLKEKGDLNDIGFGKYKMAKNLENLILFGVSSSKPKEIPKFCTYEGRNYVSKQAIKELIDNGDLILV